MKTYLPFGIACLVPAFVLLFSACSNPSGDPADPGGPTEITSASVGGLVAPKTGEAPAALGALSAGHSTYTVQSISWIPEVSETFAGDTEYSAAIVLKAVPEHTFSGSITPAVNSGTAGAGTLSGDTAENTLSFSVSFSKTDTVTVFGKVWAASGVTTGKFNGIHFGGGKFVALPSTGGIIYSTDGISWQEASGDPGIYSAVHYGSNRWVAASGKLTNNTIIYSDDGVTWYPSDTSGAIQSVYYAEGLWLAGYDTSNRAIYSEDNGATWSSTDLPAYNYSAFRYANGVWLAGGNNDKGIQYSANGKTGWTDSNTTSKNFYWFEYAEADSIWVAESNNGLYYSENDGQTWVKSNVPTDSWNFSIWYNGGTWVAGSGFNSSTNDSAGIWYSNDGKIWQPTNVTDGICLAFYTGSLWIASKMNYDGSTEEGRGLLYSTDGITWTSSNITSCFYAFAYGNDTIVACAIDIVSSSTIPDTGIFYSK
ncbi:MAG: glycoside hydrolase [Treponema sp.]|nr:glycoside hydrolase [Treponema sp.]